MTNRHFGDFVADLHKHDGRLAMTIRPFLKLERLHYDELQRRIYQTARYLVERGIRSGDRIVIVANNSPEWVQTFLAAQLIGAIVVPVDSAGSPSVILKVLEETKPSLIFRNAHLHRELGTTSTVENLDDLGARIDEFPVSAPDVELSGDEAGLVVFTSGTTAAPKGVVLTQKNVLANVEAALRVVDVRPDWRFLSVLPLSHMYELTGGLLAPLSNGASIFYVPSSSPLALLRALQEYQITTILAIPQLLILLLERIRATAAGEGKAKTLATSLWFSAALPTRVRRVLFRRVHSQLGGRLDLVITGGAPIPVEVGAAWEHLGVKLLQGYGLTETAPILTMNPLQGRRLDSAGLALDNVQLRIGENGEIQAKGPSVFRGYWRNPAASREAFTSDGWFRTGDAGHLQDGWLYIRGRLKFAIILSNGLKVFPEDIELVADRFPVLGFVCVVGVSGPVGEGVVAVVISDAPDAEIDRAIDDINARVESFQHVSEWRRWPEAAFPLTRLRKIDRGKVQAWANRTGTGESAGAPGTARRDDAIIGVILQCTEDPRREIHDTDRLSDLDLDSLRRLTVVALVEDQLGITIAEEDVTQTTTVGRLRELVAAGSPAERPVPRPSWPFRRWVRVLGDMTREVLVRGIVGMWVSMSVEGRENLNHLDGPALYIFNHSDDFDGPVVYQALPRRIRRRLAVAVADDVMRAHRALAFMARFCFAGFNLARTEPYMPSMEYVATLVDRGWNVVLAPEGRLSTDGVLQPFKSGIGLLAVNLGIPVVPIKTVGLFGTVPLHAKWPRRHSVVTVRIGRPVRFDGGMDYDEIARILHQAVQDL